MSSRPRWNHTPAFKAKVAPAAIKGGQNAGAAREDRRADAGERFFRGSAHQGGIAERKMLMKRLGIEAPYRRPRTMKPSPATRFIRICCAAWLSRVRTRFGRWTSRISR